MPELNKFQKAAAADYVGGEYAHITTTRQADLAGDQLFTFIISELGDVEEEDDPVAGAVMRMERAAEQLTDLAAAMKAVK